MPTWTRWTKLCATGLSLAIVMLSPGLESYQTAAQSFEKSPVKRKPGGDVIAHIQPLRTLAAGREPSRGYLLAGSLQNPNALLPVEPGVGQTGLGGPAIPLKLAAPSQIQESPVSKTNATPYQPEAAPGQGAPASAFPPHMAGRLLNLIRRAAQYWNKPAQDASTTLAVAGMASGAHMPMLGVASAGIGPTAATKILAIPHMLAAVNSNLAFFHLGVANASAVDWRFGRSVIYPLAALILAPLMVRTMLWCMSWPTKFKGPKNSPLPQKVTVYLKSRTFWGRDISERELTRILTDLLNTGLISLDILFKKDSSGQYYASFVLPTREAAARHAKQFSYNRAVSKIVVEPVEAPASVPGGYTGPEILHL